MLFWQVSVSANGVAGALENIQYPVREEGVISSVSATAPKIIHVLEMANRNGRSRIYLIQFLQVQKPICLFYCPTPRDT